VSPPLALASTRARVPEPVWRDGRDGGGGKGMIACKLVELNGVNPSCFISYDTWTFDRNDTRQDV
jgi:hypothetical protein